MADVRERQIRTTRAQRRFDYGPRPTTLAQVADAGYASLPIAQSDVTNLVTDLAAKAPLASPTFTGDPRAPTPLAADNDTSIATTAFVKAQSYLTGNQAITLGGDLSGSGTTSITATLTANSVVTTDITNANVTYAKIQNVAANRLLGNSTGSAAVVGEIALPLAATLGGTGLASGTSGGVPYFSTGTTLASSAALTANALIKGGGAGAAPVASTATVDGSGNLTVTGRAALPQTDFGTSLATRKGFVDGTSGNASFDGTLTVGGSVSTTAGNISITQAPTTAWAIDANGCQTTIANGSSALIPAGSGMVMVNCANISGDVALYMCGGGSVILVASLGAGALTFVSPTTTPAAGKASLAWSGSAYRIYSNVGSSQVFRVMLLRVRDNY
jgi:hypothetical protein